MHLQIQSNICVIIFLTKEITMVNLGVVSEDTPGQDQECDSTG